VKADNRAWHGGSGLGFRLAFMLGADAGWVCNLKASEGRAALRHGSREEVLLLDVPPEQRARILKPFLKRALGARAHIPVAKDAPLSEFEKIAPTLPSQPRARQNAACQRDHGRLCR
jgi:hypothetical protein